MRKVLVRRLRHWKQRFDKNAEFIWRRVITYAGKKTKLGEKIPKKLQENPAKLRRFWESNTIELAEFEAPNVVTGQRVTKPKTEETSGIDIFTGLGRVIQAVAKKAEAKKALAKKAVAKKALAKKAVVKKALAKKAEAKKTPNMKKTDDDDAWLEGGEEK